MNRWDLARRRALAAEHQDGQLDLFGEPTPPSVAGSQTSLEAAESIRPIASSIRERVYNVIAVGHLPMTDDEIIDALRLSPNSVRPRRVELHAAGRIEPCGTKKTKSGRNAVTWRVVK